MRISDWSSDVCSSDLARSISASASTCRDYARWFAPQELALSILSASPARKSPFKRRVWARQRLRQATSHRLERAPAGGGAPTDRASPIAPRVMSPLLTCHLYLRSRKALSAYTHAPHGRSSSLSSQPSHLPRCAFSDGMHT